MFDEQGEHTMMTEPIESFPAAMVISDDIVRIFTEEQHPNSSAIDIDPTESGGYHEAIYDDTGLVMARIAIETHDLRNKNWI